MILVIHIVGYLDVSNVSQQQRWWVKLFLFKLTANQGDVAGRKGYGWKQQGWIWRTATYLWIWLKIVWNREKDSCSVRPNIVRQCFDDANNDVVDCLLKFHEPIKWTVWSRKISLYPILAWLIGDPGILMLPMGPHNHAKKFSEMHLLVKVDSQVKLAVPTNEAQMKRIRPTKRIPIKGRHTQ